ncbi:TIGR02270 family protein [Pseudomonas sp. GCM10022186]|uniref:TIGR02270 family protein n=1 Tax=Pseudomonas sp. GCM10022186 TaxID=3252650 RepID=UPI00361F7AD1
MNSVPAVIEQHAEEASFLALLRSYAVRAPHYDLKHLAILDGRIEAHLDGLRISGPTGLEALLARLGPHAVGEMFASTVLAFESGDAQVLMRLSEHLRSAGETEPGYRMALGWLDWEHVSPWIERMLASPEPLFRRLGLAACGMHRRDPGAALLAGLSHTDPGVLARAARTAGELRRRDLMPAIRAHRLHADDNLRFWSNWATAQMGDEEALGPLRPFAEQPGEHCDRAFDVLLCWQKRETSMAWLRGLTQDAGQRRLLIKGAGLLGDPVSIPWLIQQMGDLPQARVAGEAFSLITGADLALLDLESVATPDYDAGPTDDPDDPNVAMDPDQDLPWPDPQLVQAWWQANQRSFQAGTPYLLGAALNERRCLEVLASGQQRQRIAAACALARFRPTRALFPTSAPAKRQRALVTTGP